MLFESFIQLYFSNLVTNLVPLSIVCGKYEAETSSQLA